WLWMLLLDPVKSVNRTVISVTRYCWRERETSGEFRSPPTRLLSGFNAVAQILRIPESELDNDGGTELIVQACYGCFDTGRAVGHYREGAQGCVIVFCRTNTVPYDQRVMHKSIIYEHTNGYKQKLVVQLGNPEPESWPGTEIQTQLTLRGTLWAALICDYFCRWMFLGTIGQGECQFTVRLIYRSSFAYNLVFEHNIRLIEIRGLRLSGEYSRPFWNDAFEEKLTNSKETSSQATFRDTRHEQSKCLKCVFYQPVDGLPQWRSTGSMHPSIAFFESATHEDRCQWGSSLVQNETYFIRKNEFGYRRAQTDDLSGKPCTWWWSKDQYDECVTEESSSGKSVHIVECKTRICNPEH
ncbi:hypothetical protein CSKR_102000, partial [Clonorchis sinensis]